MIRVLSFAAAFLAVPLFGFSIVAAIDESASHEPGILAAAGAAFLTAEMTLFSVLGIAWRPLGLAAAPALASLAAFAWTRLRRHSGPDPRGRRSIGGRALILASLGALLMIDAAATASATSIDFVYFWGTKALRFWMHGGIDFAFLAAPENRLLHPDYPPLFPLMESWAALVAGSFSWWGPIVATPGIVLLSGWSMWRLARWTVSPEIAGEISALLVVLQGFGLVATSSFGNAEALLLCWETQALSLLMFRRETIRNDILASLALSAAVLTKVEGAAFFALAAAVFSFSEKKFHALRFFRLAALPTFALSCWIAIAHARGLENSYALANPYGAPTLVHGREVILSVVRVAAYGAGFLPWIAVAVLLAASPRPAALGRPAVLAGGYGLFIVYCYLHGTQHPADWILVSAPRLLLTPLTVLVLGAAAGWRILPSGE